MDTRGMGDPEHPVEIELSILTAQQALRESRSSLEKNPKRSFFLQDFPDSRRNDSGLIEFPLKPAPAIEGDRDDAIVSPKPWTAREKESDFFRKKANEIPAPFKFYFMKNFFDGILITEKRPALVPMGKGNPDSFLRGEEFEFLELATAEETEPLFFEFKKAVTGGAKTWVKKS